MSNIKFKSALVSLSERCNFGCRFCYRADVGRSDITLDVFSRTMSVLRQLGVRSVCLTGGEPTAHTLFGQMVRISRQFGLRCSVVTAAREEGELARLEECSQLIDVLNFSSDTTYLNKWTVRSRPIQDYSRIAAFRQTRTVLNVTFFRVSDEDLYALDRVRADKHLEIDLSPMFATDSVLKSLSLNHDAYLDQLADDTTRLASAGLIDQASKASAVAAANAKCESKSACRSNRLYVSPSGELRFCPYGGSFANVFDRRARILTGAHSGFRSFVNTRANVCSFVSGCTSDEICSRDDAVGWPL